MILVRYTNSTKQYGPSKYQNRQQNAPLIESADKLAPQKICHDMFLITDKLFTCVYTLLWNVKAVMKLDYTWWLEVMKPTFQLQSDTPLLKVPIKKALKFFFQQAPCLKMWKATYLVSHGCLLSRWNNMKYECLSLPVANPSIRKAWHFIY